MTTSLTSGCAAKKSDRVRTWVGWSGVVEAVLGDDTWGHGGGWVLRPSDDGWRHRGKPSTVVLKKECWRATAPQIQSKCKTHETTYGSRSPDSQIFVWGVWGPSNGTAPTSAHSTLEGWVFHKLSHGLPRCSVALSRPDSNPLGGIARST